MQATAAQQAEMKKIKGLQEKLGAELSSLSQKMTELQTVKLDGGAEGQVRHLCNFVSCLISHQCLRQHSTAVVIKYVTSKRRSHVQAQLFVIQLMPFRPPHAIRFVSVIRELVCICW